MWFVLLGIALLVVLVAGLYFRRRVLAALEVFAVGPRARRAVGLAILWLLYGVPVLTFVVVFVSVALGRESFSIAPTGILEWVAIYPFWMAVLVMLQAVPFLLVTDLVTLVVRRRLSVDRLRRGRAVACLAVIAIFAVYTPLRIVLERDALDVHQYDVRAGETSTAAPLRIAFFADLQVDTHTDGARTREVVSLVNDHEPDLVLVGGDWINTGADHIEEAARAGGEIESRLGVLSVRGDHEHFAYRDQQRSVEEVTRALAASGVEMVDNEVRFIEHQGATIAIVLLSYNYIFRTPVAEIRRLIERAQDADYSILVTHQFDSVLAELVVDRIDLALIAHTHGGQVNPVIGFTHVSLARAETPYIAGRYQLGETTLIVTSGVGFSIAPFRYAARASIEIIDLHL